MQTVSRNLTLDAMKGIAIIAVVLYHLGIMPNGYLGVDIFLVINGYFITQGIMSSYAKGGLSYFQFLCKRIVRLWPMVVLAGLVALSIGYFVMLPDDLENFGQSMVASNLCANNILACITTGNYWDLVNEHKPLMHFWYVGIVVQCYVVYPLLFMVLYKCCRKENFVRASHIALWVLLIASALLFILPGFSTAQKFYYLPFRFFEMALGGTIALGCQSNKDNSFVWMRCSVYAVIAGLMLFADDTLCVVKVLIISVLSGGISASLLPKNFVSDNNNVLRLIAAIGKASFSIFVWHQVVFAFYKYAITSTLGVTDYVITLLITVAVSWASFRWIETPLGKYSKEHAMKILGITTVIALITTLSGLALYARAGVVRDIPELDVYTNNIHRGMHAEYCDRVYKMENDFENNGKTKVIAIGDSYARDFVNVLLESKYRDSLDIRYIYPHGKLTDAEKQRIKQADIVFIRACYSINNMQSYFASVRELCSDKPFYGIGTKEYGISNGDVYQRRNQADYYQTKVQMSANYQEEYEKEKIYWGELYVDFVSSIADNNGLLPIFTDEQKFISQDCRHLTRSGAKYYAQILPLGEMLGKQISE